MMPIVENMHLTWTELHHFVKTTSASFSDVLSDIALQNCFKFELEFDYKSSVIVKMTNFDSA